jgi:hypothetical protein
VPSTAEPDLLQVNVLIIYQHLADNPAIAVLLIPVDLDIAIMRKVGQALFAHLAKRLALLRCVNASQSYLVLGVGRIQQGERVAVRNAHHTASEDVSMSGRGEKSERNGNQGSCSVKVTTLHSWLHSMADLSSFQQYYKLADIIIEKASKDQLAECARLLALNLAHYQGLYGEVPLDKTLAILDVSEPNDEQTMLLAGGMKILVGVLGNVVSGLGVERH